MPMQPREIKAAMVLHGVTQTAVARATGFTQSYVADIIAGNRRNAGIEQQIATGIGRDVAEVFAPRERAVA